MASEVFNNYLASKTLSPNATITIVPVAGGKVADANGIGSRTADSVAQLHSIYITQLVDQNYTSDPVGHAAYITLSVYDESAQKRFPIAHNVLVLPHSAFYIEKTITLKNRQRLDLTLTSQNTVSKQLSCVCSGVDMIQ